MHLLVKMQENGRKSMFSDKQTINKVPLMFLDVKVLREREQCCVWTLSLNKESTVYVFSA